MCRRSDLPLPKYKYSEQHNTTTNLIIFKYTNSRGEDVVKEIEDGSTRAKRSLARSLFLAKHGHLAQL